MIQLWYTLMYYTSKYDNLIILINTLTFFDKLFLDEKSEPTFRNFST